MQYKRFLIAGFLSLWCCTASLAATNINLVFNTTYGSTISEPGEQDIYIFNGTVGDRLYYDALDRDYDAVYVRLVSPSGVVVHIPDYSNSDQDVGPFILTESGQYSLILDAGAELTTDYQFRLLNLASMPSLTLGTTLVNQLGQRTETDIFQFNGTEGQRVNLKSVLVNGSASQASWSLLSPAHVPLTFPGSVTSVPLTSDLGTVTLPFSGPYYLFVVGNVSDPTPLTYQVLVTDVSETPMAVSGLNVQRSGAVFAGQTYTTNFTAPAGLPVYFDSLDRGGNTLVVEVRDPSSNLVFAIQQTADAGPYVLPRSGTYTLQVRGNGPSDTGLFRFRLLDLSSAQAISLNGPATTNLTVAYQTDVYRLNGTVGQRLYYDALDNDSDQVSVRLRSPDGTFVVNQNSESDRGPFALPMSGTYYLFQESNLATSSRYQFQLFDLASQPALPLDTDLVGSLDPGRGVKLYQLAGTAGQQLFFDGKGADYGGFWNLYAPNNAAVFYNSYLPYDSEVTLGVSGTYVVALSGNADLPVAYSNRVVTFGFATNTLILGNIVSNTIAEPGEQDVYTFTGTTGQRLFYDALQNDPDQINIQLINPSGAVVHLNGNSDSDVGPFTLTQSGTYTLVVDGYGDAVGDYSFRLLEVGTQPALPLDTDLVGSLDPGRGVKLYQLAGTAGQQLFFDGKGADYGGFWNLYAPNNAAVFYNSYLPYDSEVTLGVSGTYVVALSGNADLPVAYSNRVVTFGFATNTLILGNIVSNTIAEPGEQDVYTFTGTTGQRLFYDALQNDPDQINIQLINPSGAVVHLNGNSDSDVGPFTLTQSGTYTLVVDGYGDAVGDYSFRLLEVGTQPALPLDTDLVGSLDPGRGVKLYQLAGTAGQQLFFDGKGADYGGFWNLYAPNNAAVFYNSYLPYDSEVTLGVSGTYVVALSGNADLPVAYSNRVVTFGFATNTLILGNIVSNTIAEPGEQDVYTFTGTTGQRLFYDALQNDPDQINIQLINPSGAVVHLNGNSDSDVGPFTLTQSGTYTLVVDGYGDAVGDYSFRLHDLATSPALVLGTTINSQLATPTESDLFVFTGSAGQRVNLNSISAIPNQANWYLFRAPANQILASGNIISDLGDVTLPAAGLYCLSIQGNGAAATTVDYQVLVSDVSDASVATSGLGGELSGGIFAGDTNGTTFTAPAGLPVFFDSMDRGGSSLVVDLRDPTGALVVSLTQTTDAGPIVLPRSGTYSVLVHGNSPAATGLYRFRLLDLTAVPALSLNTTITNLIDPGYKTDVLRLAANAGQRLFYDALQNDPDPVYVRLISLGGTAVPQVNYSSDTDSGLFTLTESSNYYLLIEGDQTGPADNVFRLLDVGTQPALPLDTDLAGTLNPGRGAKLYQLAGTAGQQLYFDGKGSDSAANWYLYGPNDAAVSGASQNIIYDFELTLPTTGNYVLSLSGNSDAPVNYSNRVVTFGFATNTLILGNIVSNTIAEPGEQDVYTFTGTTGQRLFYDALQNDPDQIYVQLFNPSGTVVSQFSFNNSDTDVGPMTLTENGTYTLVVDGYGDAVGDYVFRLLDVGTQPALPLDTDLAGTLNPGRGAKLYQLAGTAGQQLYFDGKGSDSAANWYLYGPNDAAVSGASQNIIYDFELTLPTTGNYVLSLSGNSDAPVNYSNRVVTFGFATNTLILGNIVSNTIAEPGEQDVYTFTGTTGQRLFYDALQNDPDQIYVQLFNPSGTVVSQFSFNNSDTDVGPMTLTENGTYTLVVDGYGDAVGDYVFRLLDVGTQPALPLDTDLAGTLNPGRGAKLYQLAGTAGQQLYFDGKGSDSAANWYLYGPNDAAVSGASQNIIYDFELTLPTTGNYVLSLSGNSDAPVNYSNRVVTLNDNPNVTANSAPVLGFIADQIIGDGVLLTFTATATDGNAGDTKTFSLDSGAPPAATINPTTGVFAWVPPSTGFSSVNAVTIRVTDNGVPPLSGAQTFNITVISGPVITSIARTAGAVTVVWRSAPAKIYRFQYKRLLTDPTWQDVSPGSDVTATGLTASQVDSGIGTDAQRVYYRVALLNP